MLHRVRPHPSVAMRLHAMFPATYSRTRAGMRTIRVNCSGETSTRLHGDGRPTSPELVAAIFGKHGVHLKPEELDAVLAKVPQMVETPARLEELAINVNSLRTYLTPADLRQVTIDAPAVLIQDLATWFAFLSQFGFSEDQIGSLLCQAPLVLSRATLVSAGQALTTMREAGLDEGTIKAFIVNYPQLLHGSREEILSMLRTLSRFASGINISC